MQTQNKTIPTGESVSAFISGVTNVKRRQEAEELLELFGRCTGLEAIMWGPSIIGFGLNHYRYASGREGDQPAVGFSPRASNLVLYGLINTAEAREQLTSLGKCRTGAGCLYLGSLSNANLDVLAKLIRTGFDLMHNQDS